MNLLNIKKRFYPLAALVGAAGLAMALAAGFSGAGAASDPDAARNLVSRYLKAVYAQDYAEAYKYISQRDREAKSEAAYLRENPSLTGAAAELVRRLAERIEVGPLSSEIRDDNATVRFPISLPDANSADCRNSSTASIPMC